jgi:outer membrane protein assembly factor BamA
MSAVAVCTAVSIASAQSFTPRTVQFKGVPEYTSQELLAAARIRAGEPLDGAKIAACGQRLLNTGVFATVSYKFNNQEVIFELSPATDLLPVHLDNLPLTPGSELTDKLHARLPLFHGKVPPEGELNDEVTKALKEILAEQGLIAVVQATASGSQSTGAFVTYSIVTPPVTVGDIRLSDESAKLDPAAQEITEKLMGSSYQVEGSPSQISTYLSNYYRDKGYIEADVDVLPHGVATAAPDSIRVPFTITVKPGILYKLASVKLAPDLLVSQADFDQQSQIHSGDIARYQRLIENWELIARQYHDHGYMKASIHPEPTFDRDKATVSYYVTAEPGPVYTMGKLTIENFSGEVRDAILSAWKMPEGATFNEGAIRGFLASPDMNPAVQRVLARVRISYKLTLRDGDRSVDVALKLEQKP